MKLYVKGFFHNMNAKTGSDSVPLKLISDIVISISALAAFVIFRLMLCLILQQIQDRRRTAQMFFLEGFVEIVALTLLIMLIVFLMRRVEKKGAVLFVFAFLPLFAYVVYKDNTDNKIDTRYRRNEYGLYTLQPGIEFKDFYCHTQPGVACRTDREGWRTCPFSDVKNAPTIALIGDSWVFGWGLDESNTLCSLLENELIRRGLGGFRIKNFAIPGLNFSSYAKIAELSSKHHIPDWIFIGYLSYTQGASGSDTDPYDMLYFGTEGQGRIYYRIMVALLGKEPTMKIHQLYNWYDRSSSPAKKAVARLNKEIISLEKLSDKSNVVLVCYYGEDKFTDALKGRIKRLKVVDFSLSDDPQEGNFLPNDPHPSAKANRTFAKRITDIIASDRKEALNR